MSWLGGTLSSLTNQISNLTSEVLLEGREELDDQGAQLQLFKARLEQLEGCNATLRKELERLRSANAELEDRCHATELQLCAERRSREERNNHTVSSPVILAKELERALSQAAIERQEEVAALQSHHAGQLALLQRRLAEDDAPSSLQKSGTELQVPKPDAPHEHGLSRACRLKRWTPARQMITCNMICASSSCFKKSNSWKRALLSWTVRIRRPLRSY
ncbi:hypothetical protein MRX96_021319 [Rhipicephalus microplus]